MRFTKMHGIGNDYVYVNGFEQRVADPAALAPRIADRHTGVGGDGLILILPPSDRADAHVRMRIFNADGSEAEMCGNGVRCVAKYAVDHGLADARPLRVETGHGVLSIDYDLGPDGKLVTATVDMGEPILDPARLPARVADAGESIVGVRFLDRIDWAAHGIDPGWLERSGADPGLTGVSMGNPHAVFFVEDVAAVPLEAAGPVIERHSAFPNRINVHFVQVHERGEATMRTWERGSGVTLACGTGASAVCVAGVLTGRTGRELLAHLPGGDLTLRWDERTGRVYMTGPAAEVFTGTWPD